MKVIDWMITIFLIGLFAFSGVDKFLHLDGFINALNSYRILPIPIGEGLAPLVIAAELLVALGLTISRWRRRAALQAAMLMSVFTVALLFNHLLGERGVCGCWFSINMAKGETHLVLNILLILMCLFVWHASKPGQVDTVRAESAL